MDNLKIAIVQTYIYWEDIEKNLLSLSNKIETLRSKVDLLVLPEMFASGFTMKGKEKVAKQYNEILEWMQRTASKHEIVIIGTTIYSESEKYYNRSLTVYPNKEFKKYDKRHLFTMGEESNHFTPGKEMLIIDIKGWKIRPFICYDLRFPVWNRYTQKNPYDIAIYSANWPEARKDVWMTLLKARAIENQSYVVGVNCVGEDGNKLKYSGDSGIYNYKGEKVAECKASEESIEIVEISKEELLKFRKEFPVLLDADIFEIINN